MLTSCTGRAHTAPPASLTSPAPRSRSNRNACEETRLRKSAAPEQAGAGAEGGGKTVVGAEQAVGTHHLREHRGLRQHPDLRERRHVRWSGRGHRAHATKFPRMRRRQGMTAMRHGRVSLSTAPRRDEGLAYLAGGPQHVSFAPCWLPLRHSLRNRAAETTPLKRCARSGGGEKWGSHPREPRLARAEKRRPQRPRCAGPGRRPLAPPAASRLAELLELMLLRVRQQAPR